jgi:hypothetical protein
MNVKHTAKLPGVKAAWEAGVPGSQIMREFGLTKGTLSTIVSRNGWKRPWRSLKSLRPRQQTIYKKLRHQGISRRDAFEAVTT